MRRVAPALGLFFLAPFVGEFLLGNLTLGELGQGLVLVAAAGVIVIGRWSRQDGWSQRHVFALAAGAMLTYVWTAFPVRPESGGSITADLIGNAVFGAVALLLLAVAARVSVRQVSS